MFPSLRAKLAFAFAFVTFLTVLLTALGITLLLREREIAAARERLGLFGNAVANEVMEYAGRRAQPDALGALLQQRAEELDLRFVLIDGRRNVVVVDTAGRLTGQPADELSHLAGSMHRSDIAGFGWTAWRGQIVFVPRVGPVLQSVQQQDYTVLMLVPESDIAGAWRDLLPRLALSGGAALLAAVGVAFIISQSIARPVADVTRAAEAVAQGNYDQRLPVRGRDEIARLARTFNVMAHQVARSHQAMRDLIGNVAHELKTPLTSIQGYSQALLEGLTVTPEETAHAARVIYEEGERMRRLVEDLLYLTRLESGQLRLERAPVRVPALLETAAERVRWQIQNGGRQLQVHIPVDLPTVYGDEHRLEQVLANLLDNAVQHTPPGGRITLSAAWLPDGVAISVHNTGSYIPPEHLPRIFERFYQVDPARTRDGRHGGLGLAIAREIVLAHGGTITAYSDVHTGTEFRVVLPTGRRATSDEAPAPAAATAPAPQGQSVV